MVEYKAVQCPCKHRSCTEREDDVKKKDMIPDRYLKEFKSGTWVPSMTQVQAMVDELIERRAAASNAPISVADAGRKGGRKVRDERGQEFYQEIGRKGGAAVRTLIEAGKRAVVSKRATPKRDDF
jgi:general stress protein YciG